jgi:AraC-like DNA-binding protein
MLNQNEGPTPGSEVTGSEQQEKYTMSGFVSQNGINDISPSEQFIAALSKVDNESVNKRKRRLLEDIKRTIIEMVYYSEAQLKTKYSSHLSQTLGYNYTYMANIFSEVHGYSIQNFIITTKIERVKELLVHEGMTLTEISFKLNYSSVAHLSNQFKKVTGVSPSEFIASMENSNSLPYRTPVRGSTQTDAS